MRKRFLMVDSGILPIRLGWKDFDNPEVLAVLNPHPYWGYCHGPIHDPNVMWKPKVDVDAAEDAETVRFRNFLEFMEFVESEKDAQAAVAVKGTVQAKNAVNPDDLTKGIEVPDINPDIQTIPPPPPRQMLLINPHNCGVCDIIVELPDVMCGFKAGHSAEMHAHLQLAHSGATIRPMRHNLDDAWKTCISSLKRWVLTGGWREAKYRLEPVRLRPGSLIDIFCENLERIAREDASFADKWGCQFHRYSAHLGSMDDVEWGNPGYRSLTARADKINYPGKEERFLS
ncbi:hypothetical protein N7486_002792 [Penicillium sp. IBT 16267x]|nr:hypothetical protein N7486_002792 [Penicillium sp. IBT 16267x]